MEIEKISGDQFASRATASPLIALARELAVEEGFRVTHPDVRCMRGDRASRNKRCSATDAVLLSGHRDGRKYETRHVTTNEGEVKIEIIRRVNDKPH